MPTAPSQVTPALSRSPAAQQAAARPVSPGLRAAALLAAALGASGLLYLGYFPLSQGYLLWVALVPWLALVRSTARARLLYPLALLSGLAFYVPVIQWMRVADPRMVYTWLGLSCYCALYFPLALWILRFLGRRTPLPLVLTFPVAWTALEYTRSTFATGFSWYLLAHSQHDYLTLIQVADVTGAWGLSFLVALVNALLFEAAWAVPGVRRLLGEPQALPARRSLLVGGPVVALLLVAVALYGRYRLGQQEREAGPQVALIQGNVPQGLRNLGSNTGAADQPTAARDIAGHYYALSDLAVCYRPDLVVWPETSFPEDWPAIAPGHHAQAPREWKEHHRVGQDFLRGVSRRWPASVLLGLNARIYHGEGDGRRHNTALLVDPQGGLAGLYHKMHRVPFGEYVPLRETFPWMEAFAPYDFDYSIWPGEEFTRFPVRSRAAPRLFTFGTIICYEDTDPAVTRPYLGGDGQAAVDFLVNISNDGWFDGTSEHEEHLAICRFRAVEMRRSVARSVNMGISAVIDSSGRVLRPQPLPQPSHLGLLGFSPVGDSLAGVPWVHLLITASRAPRVWGVSPEAPALPVGEWAEYKKVPGVLLAGMPIDTRSSLYARLGDWLPGLCWALLLLALAAGFLWPVRHATDFSPPVHP